jgi:hypothetical protein
VIEQAKTLAAQSPNHLSPIANERPAHPLCCRGGEIPPKAAETELANGGNPLGQVNACAARGGQRQIGDAREVAALAAKPMPPPAYGATRPGRQ